MQTLQFPTTAREVASLFNAPIIGNQDELISFLSSVQTAEVGSLSYLSDRKYVSRLATIKGGVVLTQVEFADETLPLTYIVVKDPKRVFAQIAKEWLPKNPWIGISAKAEIHPQASVHPSAHVGPFTIIGEGAKIGANTVIYPHCYIGPGVEVGEACEIYSHVNLVTLVRIGNRVRIFSGSVLGSEGFGFLEGATGYTEMPQLGKVVVEDDVRIGANCTIDRSTLGETLIGRGSKLDNLVHVGHNCKIGKNCIVCAQVGLAGSTLLEDDVILGGQVGLGGHLTVGKGARVGGQSGTSTNLKGGVTYFSTPSIPVREALRSYRYLKTLPELVGRIRIIEGKLNEQ